VREQLSQFYKGNNRLEKELQIFADESQMDAYLKEASALTAGGDGKGGRTGYDPVFAALRLANPMRGLSRTVATDGSSYQFRVKTGNAGVAWGYTIQNNDQAAQSVSNPYGGTNGLRGLDSYGGSNATYTGGTTSAAAFGTSGTGSTSGLHSLATYDQITTNGNTVGANNIQYKDVINLVMALPQQYWTANAKFMVSPILAQAIRSLQDTNGRPIFNSMESLNSEGIIGQMLGFDVVMNKYLDAPFQAATGAAGTNSLYPMYFADFSRFHTIIDRLNMVMRRYDQTLPGSITFYGEKRLATSVRDPNAGVRYRSTGTST